MAESTYSLAKSDLDERIGHFLGYGPTSGNWSAAQQADIDRAREEGLTRFYGAFNWTFLTPAATLAVSASIYNIALPDNFGWIIDTFNFNNDDVYSSLRMVSVGEIQRKRTQSSSTGIPYLFAISAKTNDATTTARYEVLLYPTPTAVYTLNYRYRVLRDALTTGEYPLGGAMHRNTMVESCLAAAEAQLDDNTGLHENRYRMFLADSISADKMNKPKFYGKNDDRSVEYLPDNLPIRSYLYNGA